MAFVCRATTIISEFVPAQFELKLAENIKNCTPLLTQFTGQATQSLGGKKGEKKQQRPRKNISHPLSCTLHELRETSKNFRLWEAGIPPYLAL